jgi:hypothetical protein
MSRVVELLRRVQVVAPQTVGGLQVFGLKLSEVKPLSYSTLDEALSQNELEVTEVSEGGSVPTLKVTNKSDHRVFLMAGEHLIGAKQNRVLNTSIMIEKKSEVPIPVSCVEQGRWSYRSRNFGSHGTTSHGKLRKMMTTSVTESYLACAAPISDQGEVWNEVNRKLTSMGSVSGSHAMEQVYEDHGKKLEDFTKELLVPEGCDGAVFVVHGQVAGIDLFDQSGTLKKLWPKLLRGYAIDVLEENAPDARSLTTAEVETWLQQATQAEPKSFPSPGVGEDIRLKSPTVTGATLVVDSQPVHLQLFAESVA